MKMEQNAEKTCPECHNHCPSDQLRCPKGMEYFGIEPKKGQPFFGNFGGDLSSMAAEDAVIMLMRKCGHYLHHNVGHREKTNNKELLSTLTEEEIKELAKLLEKCTQNW